jgi:hypothetical protein
MIFKKGRRVMSLHGDKCEKTVNFVDESRKWLEKERWM